MLKTMYKLITAFMVCVATSVSAAEVYKTVDEDGNPTFTDQASDDAEKIEIKDIITIPGLKNTRPFAKSNEPNELYKRVIITNPTSDETYFRSQGSLLVAVQLSPPLRGIDSLVFYLDGMEIYSGKSSSYSISELDRGTHSISAAVMSADGNIIKKSESVTFHVRQASALGR